MCGVLKLTAVARVYTETVTLDLKVLTVKERVYTETVILDLKVSLRKICFEGLKLW
jgi:hypothetical protein